MVARLLPSCISSRFKKCLVAICIFECYMRNITNRLFCVIRNCVQHNREPTDVEQLSGEAAIAWLERILDQYEEKDKENAKGAKL